MQYGIESNNDAGNQWLYALGIGGAAVAGISYLNREKEDPEAGNRRLTNWFSPEAKTRRTEARAAKSMAADMGKASALYGDVTQSVFQGDHPQAISIDAFKNTSSRMIDKGEGERLVQDLRNTTVDNVDTLAKNSYVQQHAQRIKDLPFWQRKRAATEMANTGMGVMANTSEAGVQAFKAEATGAVGQFNQVVQKSGRTSVEKNILKAIASRIVR